MGKITLEEIKELTDRIDQPKGMDGIIVMPNEMIPQGRPVLLMNPFDYEEYRKKIIPKVETLNK